MQVVDNSELIPFPSLKVEAMTQEKLDEILLFVETVLTDIRQVKKTVFKVAEMIGAIDENGELSTDIDGVKIMGIMSEQFLPRMPFQKKKEISKLDFLKDLIPVLDKYKNI